MKQEASLGLFVDRDTVFVRLDWRGQPAERRMAHFLPEERKATVRAAVEELVEKMLRLTEGAE